MTRHAFDLPTCRPLLPSCEALKPYLHEIDSHRWYSNFGPLTQRFEAKIARRLDAEPGSIVMVANATAGLTLALLDATDGKDGLCVVPAWTFAATPIAARNAGLTPFFVDVDARTWQIDPDRLRELARAMPGRIRAVMPVAPFGEPVDLAAWACFSRATGIKVVVDAASAFDGARSHRELVSVVSLHATKVLGVGDGGFIIAGTAARGERLRRMSNFGFDSGRRSVMPGMNAKMSEYSAAVGLAALSRWPATRAAFLERSAALSVRLARHSRLASREAGFASATFNVVTAGHEADALVAWLRARGLEARKWWAEGCHRHPTFADAPHADLSVTDDLVARVVALPFWVDMSAREIDLVAEGVGTFGSPVRRAAEACVG